MGIIPIIRTFSLVKENVMRVFPYSALIFILSGATVAYASDHKLNFTLDPNPDLVLYNPSSNTFYFQDAVEGASQTAVTLSSTETGDQGVLGDFDGDGLTDLATFERNTAFWNIRYSVDASEESLQLGDRGDFPYSADIDGDGCDELVSFSPETGIFSYSLCSSREARETAQVISETKSGLVPVLGDYDGDNQDDFAVYDRSSNLWTIRYSSNNELFSFFCGLQGDIPLVGDFDGDGRAEPVVHRPNFNNTFITEMPLEAGSLCEVVGVKQWGLNGDIPLALNVDDDDITDFVVYRSFTGEFYIETSQGDFRVIQTTSIFDATFNSPLPLSTSPSLPKRIRGGL